MLSDRPEVYGLPPQVENLDLHNKSIDIWSLQKQVLKNPAIWVLGLSSALMYVARYSVNNWAILFLQEEKSYSLIKAGSIMAFYPIAGILGSIFSAMVSDKFFNSKRRAVTFILGAMQVFSMLLLFLTPANFWIDALALSLFGIATGGLMVFIGGLLAVDLSNKKVAGAAMGLIGIFSYIGASLQEYISGHLVESSRVIQNTISTYNFDSAIYFWVSSAIGSTLLAFIVLSIKERKLSQK